MTAPTELSYEQRRIWREETRRRDPAAHHLTASYELTGPLEPAVLARAARAVAARHELLRTAFHDGDGQPHGTAHETAPPLLRVVPVASAEECAELAEAEARARFDLATPPLARLTLCAVNAGHHVLTVVLHRLVADEAALDVLLDELADAYLALRDGDDWRRPEPPTPYRRHVERERAAAADGSWEEDLAYWRNHLRDAPETCDLPGGGPRPGAPPRTPRPARAALTSEEAEALRAIAHRHRVAPAAVPLAAWVATLSRYGGARDILVAVPVPGRDSPEHAGVIGPFADVVVLRTRPRPEMTFGELVAHVEDERLAALAHRRPPSAAVTADLAADGTAPSSPHQLLFDCGDSPPPAFARVPGVRCQRLPATTAAPRADLELAVTGAGTDHPVELTLAAGADSHLEETTTLLLDHTVTLLRHALAAPTTPAGQLSLITEERRRELVTRCAPPPTPLPEVRSVLELVIETIARRPDAPALRAGRRELTFAQVGARAARLAERLARHGVTAGGVVALHLDRSIELPIAMLASWQLGAAYVPVDPAYPRRRVEFVLHDARAQAVVTGSAAPDEAFAALGVPVVVVDPAVGERADGDPAESPRLTARDEGGGEDPAYVLYTSGSTGEPKGARVPHRALANLLLSMARRPGVTSGDVILGLTSPSFDMSVPELLLPFTTGARMVVASTVDARDPRRLLDLVLAEGVTVMQATPVTWGAFLALAPDTLRLRLATCAGEALTRQLADGIRERADEVWNMYGTTETTVYSLIAPVRPEEEDPAVPVGRPVDNTSAWVLDAGLRPQPPGVVGELYLGGAGLALDYHGRPDLTGQRFVTGPPETGGERLYRTGDLVRMRPDGVFDFVGRTDTQTKIRGHRIEVDEIATLLRRHPRVRDAVVVVRDDGAGNRRLVAYVVPAGD
ncbi:amino acid adenylation domain-containing protein [Streptomyces sp. AJS327]|uniref:non-ribosomal peptide synthetase n=1 Tax=Streptomyces sp. AJS327 TaxID=2545265 RepID=UPI0015DD95DB|nr:amino acid adenylation domain-containing protein [Streptomyces sp. AJS327]MBA0051208.1 amino acid adenylation domain-containing protein [Streptomyces sp. AJS327]